MTAVELAESADLNPPAAVSWIAGHLRDGGHEAWAVGGAVRDALVGLKPGDWDLTTSARPGQVRGLFRRTVPLGIEHGTVGVIARDGEMYEVTTFRRDVETFGRKARVVFADSLDEDLDRRDFTMNAVAWNPLTGELRDPHRGIADLAAGVLRTVGNPTLRFDEDRLRVLRALRFAGAFGLKVEDRTWEALVAASGQLSHLSAERIRDELRKVLTVQANPARTLHLYAESGVLGTLYPELEACRGVRVEPGDEDLWSFLVRVVVATPASHYQIRLAGLLHRLAEGGAPQETISDSRSREPTVPVLAPEQEEAARSAAVARNLLRRLRSSNAEVDRTTHLIAQHAPVPPPAASEPELRRWARRVGRDHLNDLFRLRSAILRSIQDGPGLIRDEITLRRRIRAILATNPPLEIADLAIGGADLRGIGLPPGPRYGVLLESLLERVLDDPGLNTADALLDLARQARRDD